MSFGAAVPAGWARAEALPTGKARLVVSVGSAEASSGQFKDFHGTIPMKTPDLSDPTPRPPPPHGHRPWKTVQAHQLILMICARPVPSNVVSTIEESLDKIKSFS